VATYGLRSAAFANITCRAPTLAHPTIPVNHAIDQAMFVFHTSFGGKYPAGNAVEVDGWTFEDLAGNAYTPGNGTLGPPGDGKMGWTRGLNASDPTAGARVVAPYFVPPAKRPQQVNVYVTPPTVSP
jgi:hypothetical protein